MKKLLVLPLCLVLVGCGNSLTCTKEEKGEGKEKLKIIFKGEKVAKMEGIVEFENKEMAELACSAYENLKSDTIKVKCNNKKLTLTTTEVSAYEGKTKEELKEAFENQGYTCR